MGIGHEPLTTHFIVVAPKQYVCECARRMALAFYCCPLNVLVSFMIHIRTRVHCSQHTVHCTLNSYIMSTRPMDNFVYFLHFRVCVLVWVREGEEESVWMGYLQLQITPYILHMWTFYVVSLSNQMRGHCVLCGEHSSTKNKKNVFFFRFMFFFVRFQLIESSCVAFMLRR